jgi:arsenate reductase-like glutaredoxin family protein
MKKLTTWLTNSGIKLDSSEIKKSGLTLGIIISIINNVIAIAITASLNEVILSNPRID